ncbi:MAG: hypothetical protein JKY11_06680, partial [Alphaproteobacteria bacterium]|nr:hypothetical protein [Alphaproteobacteria bacterium]
TVCILTLINGWNATGESACVDPENFDKTLGENAARERAMGKVFELEGYLMKQNMYNLRRWSTDYQGIIREQFDEIVKRGGVGSFELYEQNCQPLGVAIDLVAGDVRGSDAEIAALARGKDVHISVAGVDIKPGLTPDDDSTLLASQLLSCGGTLEIRSGLAPGSRDEFKPGATPDFNTIEAQLEDDRVSVQAFNETLDRNYDDDIIIADETDTAWQQAQLDDDPGDCDA